MRTDGDDSRVDDQVVIHGDHVAVRFAARELSRYLGRATGHALPVRRSGRNPEASGFHLGVCDDLGVARPAGIGRDDDWICIKARAGGLLITGSNPRSVLFAVYRYLQERGFRWIRPSVRGEIIPTLRRALVPRIKVSESASYPYRTVCIEGACSLQHVLDMIDWMSKHAMNGCFIQFDLGTQFFSHWYNHDGHPGAKPEPFDIRKIIEVILREITRRDLRLERMGHGWTCAAIGVPGEGWQPGGQISADQRHWLAQVNGRREFSHGIPLNTNLCYSNPAVRKAIVESIAQYALSHPQVNLLHFWLGDGMNNNCECPKCRGTRPSDYYVQMLNELDERLSALHLETRIVFLIYVDLLWAPVKTRPRNPARFVLMFAPITRSFRHALLEDGGKDEGKKPFVRNRLQFPGSGRSNVNYLLDWQRLHSGDAFDFDYHGLWTCFNDPSLFDLSRVLHRDIQQLRHIHLHGLNSCQTQRVGFPHNLLMEVLASTLWNRRTSFSSIVNRCFGDAFGDSGPAIARYFRTLSRLWGPMVDGVRAPHAPARCIADGLQNLPRVSRLVGSLWPVVMREQKAAHGAARWSWQYLAKHLEYMEVLIPAFESYLRCADDTKERFEEVSKFLWRNEAILAPALDVYQCVNVVMGRVREVTQAKSRRGGPVPS